MLIDGHLDIAMNALRYERDQKLRVATIRDREAKLEGDEPGTCTMTVEELRQSNVPLCITTVIARARPGLAPERRAPRYGLDHPTADMAYASAQGQLAYYEALARQGVVTIIRTAGDLDAHWKRWAARQKKDDAKSPSTQPAGATPSSPPPLGLIITMESADPIVEPGELALWWNQGLRTLMLAHFQAGRYAYGTPALGSTEDGPITDAGVELLKEMRALGMPLDLTHLCDRSFFDAVDRFDGPIYSSHSNCRALADSPRQLSDEQIRLIADRDGVLGVALHNNMLTRPTEQDLPRDEVTLDHVAAHLDHLCQLTGSTKHAAIGSDLDGGFGREDCPRDLDTVADLHQLADRLRSRGYDDAAVADIFHDNWLRFLRRTLPRG